MSVCCECCVLSGRGLCDGLITRPEKPFRVWYVVIYDGQSSIVRRSWPPGGLLRHGKNKIAMCMTHIIFKNK